MRCGRRGRHIHEICHAIIGKGHTQKKFHARLRKAAMRARLLGRDDLAALIEDEVREYEETSPARAKHVYSGVSDLLAERPGISFKRVLSYLAQENGLTEEELLGWCPRLRAVYDEEKAFWKEVRARKRGDTGAETA